MNIISKYIYRIQRDTPNSTGIETVEIDTNDINLYITEILEELSANNIGDRTYTFIEGSISTSSYIQAIFENADCENTARQLATKLQRCEKVAQEKLQHITDIPEGILIVAHVELEEFHKIFLVKADYNFFLDGSEGYIREGLPIKKRIFKSFIAEINNPYEIRQLLTYDTSPKVAKYWYQDFLELEVVINDRENTQRALKTIQRKILSPLKKDYPHDYFCLWNKVIAYFRAEGDFNINHFKDEIIGNHTPYDPSLNIDVLKNKCTNLPHDGNFNYRFTKIPDAVRNKFKKTIILTPDIELKLKHDITDFDENDKTIKPYSDADGHYIMIRSEKGYKIAGGIINE